MQEKLENKKFLEVPIYCVFVFVLVDSRSYK